MQWADYIRIGGGCVQRHLGPRHVESPFGKLDVAASGISDLEGGYSISRSSFPCHVVFFTVRGEGVLETPGGLERLLPGTAMIVPSGVSARYSLASRSWRILWFDICDTPAWSFLRGRSARVLALEGGLEPLERTMEGVYTEIQDAFRQGEELASLLCKEAVVRVRRLLLKDTRIPERPGEAALGREVPSQGDFGVASSAPQALQGDCGDFSHVPCPRTEDGPC